MRPRRRARASRQIIGNFGVALGSTIAGIFLRVLLHQMRVDPADLENMTRIELADASKRVKAQLDEVSGNIALFQGQAGQRMNDVIATAGEAVNKMLTTFTTEVGARPWSSSCKKTEEAQKDVRHAHGAERRRKARRDGRERARLDRSPPGSGAAAATARDAAQQGLRQSRRAGGADSGDHELACSRRPTRSRRRFSRSAMRPGQLEPQAAKAASSRRSFLRHVSEAAEQFRRALGVRRRDVAPGKGACSELETQARDLVGRGDARPRGGEQSPANLHGRDARSDRARARAGVKRVASRTRESRRPMSANLDGRIGEQHAAYRKGLVLGLTMAEVGILIIFMLLLLIAFDYLQRDEIVSQYREQDGRRTRAVAATEQAETSLQEMQEALGDALGVAPNDPPDDFVRLVRVVEAAARSPAGQTALAEAQELLAEMERRGRACRARRAEDGGRPRRRSRRGARVVELSRREPARLAHALREPAREIRARNRRPSVLGARRTATSTFSMTSFCAATESACASARIRIARRSERGCRCRKSTLPKR